MTQRNKIHGCCRKNRRSTVSEGTLINTTCHCNDQPLNQISSVVSPKRGPTSAPTVTATNAQLQLQTDKGASQSYGTHSGAFWAGIKPVKSIRLPG